MILGMFGTALLFRVVFDLCLFMHSESKWRSHTYKQQFSSNGWDALKRFIHPLLLSFILKTTKNYYWVLVNTQEKLKLYSNKALSLCSSLLVQPVTQHLRIWFFSNLIFSSESVISLPWNDKKKSVFKPIQNSTNWKNRFDGNPDFRAKRPNDAHYVTYGCAFNMYLSIHLEHIFVPATAHFTYTHQVNTQPHSTLQRIYICIYLYCCGTEMRTKPTVIDLFQFISVLFKLWMKADSIRSFKRVSICVQ